MVLKQDLAEGSTGATGATGSGGSHALADLHREVAVMRKLRHRNIVSLREVHCARMMH